MKAMKGDPCKHHVEVNNEKKFLNTCVEITLGFGALISAAKDYGYTLGAFIRCLQEHPCIRGRWLHYSLQTGKIRRIPYTIGGGQWLR